MTSGASAADVVIVGGGIVATATAALLAAEDVRVRLHERTAIAAGASGRNSGIVQQPLDPVLAALYAASLAEYRALAVAPGVTFSFPTAPSGLLYVGRDPALAGAVAAEWRAGWPEARAEVLEGRELTTVEPSLAPDLVACRLEIGFPIEPASATNAFAELARARGADIVVGGDTELAIDGGRVIGVRHDGSLEPAEAVVVAAGPWTPGIVDRDGQWNPIRRSWGVVASIAFDGPPRHGLEAIDIDIEPRADSRDRDPVEPSDELVDFSLVPARVSSALGSTFLGAEPDPAAWIDGLRRVGSRYVPAIADARIVGVRHCARPVSVDGRPLVGRVPWLDGLWLAAGHGPWGISTGPGTARLLADQIMGRATDAAIPAELRPDRFGSPGSRER